MIIHVFGVPSSPLHVSTLLSNLGISHSFVSGVLRSCNKEIHLAKNQPAWPVVLPSLAAVSRYQCDKPNQILFVCDALALLATCNVRIIKTDRLDEALPNALQYAVANPMRGWKLQKSVPTISDYVSNATRPSFLNHVQEALYKIVPYDLRKEVQALIIGYLAGMESKQKLVSKLNTSHKLDRLRELVKDPKCGILRDAVALYRKNKSIEITCAETGVESFEVLYIDRSSAKAIAIKHR